MQGGPGGRWRLLVRGAAVRDSVSIRGRRVRSNWASRERPGRVSRERTTSTCAVPSTRRPAVGSSGRGFARRCSTCLGRDPRCANERWEPGLVSIQLANGEEIGTVQPVEEGDRPPFSERGACARGARPGGAGGTGGRQHDARRTCLSAPRGDRRTFLAEGVRIKPLLQGGGWRVAVPGTLYVAGVVGFARPVRWHGTRAAKAIRLAALASEDGIPWVHRDATRSTLSRTA